MKLPSFTSSVTIDVEGDITHSRWVGTFEVKRVLTHGDRFKLEQYYKEYLPDDSTVQEIIKLRAATLAELRTRVVKGPPWWEASNYGVDLVDKDPMYTLLKECEAATKRWHEELGEMVKDRPKVEGSGASG
jgi:hypothetical protein